MPNKAGDHRDENGMLFKQTAQNNISMNKGIGIFLGLSSNSLIYYNNIYSNNWSGICFRGGSNNAIRYNNISFNQRDGITLSGGNRTNITYIDDIPIHIFNGVLYPIFTPEDNLVEFNNLISNRDNGIQMYRSINNTFFNNNLTFNGFNIVGRSIECWNTHSIDNTNMVNEKPVYYWKNQNERTIPQNAGQVILVNCSNVEVSHQKITLSTVGINLGFSDNNNIINNSFSGNNIAGISLYKSNSNDFINNTSSYNENGVLSNHSINNVFYSNSYIDNKYQTKLNETDFNIWNSSYPTGGNFWSNLLVNDEYLGENQNITGKDSISDEPYIIDPNNIDHYPLMNSTGLPDNLQPFAVIKSIDPNPAFENNAIIFHGFGIDIDGFIKSYRWVSNINGFLSNQSSFNSSSLSVGNHTISFLVLDNDGEWSRIEMMNLTILKSEMEISEDILIILELSKSKFFIDENITGNITIYNNNTSNILFNNTQEKMKGLHFKIYYFEKNISMPHFYDFGLYPFYVKSKSNVTINFNLNQFFQTFDTYGNIGFEPGNYSIFSSLNQIDIMNKSKIKTHFSNNDSFEIINRNIMGIDKIELTLRIDKTEYNVGEIITGLVEVFNNNSFQVSINETPVIGLLGNHFRILSNKEISYIIGLSETIEYPITLLPYEKKNINFEINQIIDPQSLDQLQLTEGNYSIFALFYIGNYSGFGLLSSNNITFQIEENVSYIDDENNRHNKNQPELSTNVIFISVTIAISMFILMSTIFITVTEIGRYSFYQMLTPLYKREKRRGKNNSESIKASIINIIFNNPGDNYREIKRKLDLPNGTLTYYLSDLEDEGKIRAEKDGILKRFYPVNAKMEKEIFELNKIQKTIFDFLKEHPGSSQKEISVGLDLSQQRVSYNIKMMTNAQILKKEKILKRSKYTVCDDLKNYIS